MICCFGSFLVFFINSEIQCRIINVCGYTTVFNFDVWGFKLFIVSITVIRYVVFWKFAENQKMSLFDVRYREI